MRSSAKSTAVAVTPPLQYATTFSSPVIPAAATTSRSSSSDFQVPSGVKRVLADEIDRAWYVPATRSAINLAGVLIRIACVDQRHSGIGNCRCDLVDQISGGSVGDRGEVRGRNRRSLIRSPAGPRQATSSFPRRGWPPPGAHSSSAPTRAESRNGRRCGPQPRRPNRPQLQSPPSRP